MARSHVTSSPRRPPSCVSDASQWLIVSCPAAETLSFIRLPIPRSNFPNTRAGVITEIRLPLGDARSVNSITIVGRPRTIRHIRNQFRPTYIRRPRNLFRSHPPLADADDIFRGCRCKIGGLSKEPYHFAGLARKIRYVSHNSPPARRLLAQPFAAWTTTTTATGTAAGRGLPH